MYRVRTTVQSAISNVNIAFCDTNLINLVCPENRELYYDIRITWRDA